MKYSAAQQKEWVTRSKALIAAPLRWDNPEAAAAEVVTLREAITFHEWRYDVLNDPLIADGEYDILMMRLKRLEATYPALLTPDSPTRRVSSDLHSDFPTVKHLTPMLSLDNAYNAEDLADFDERVRKLTRLDANAAIAYVVEPKFDGGTVTLVYENDRLVRGATRGNGVEGEDVTHNMRAMRAIPLQAAFSAYGIYKVELRGEALIRKENFVRVNEQREEAGETLLANPRNAATGALRVKDAREVAKRQLEAFVYQVGYAVDADGNDKMMTFEDHDDYLKMLEALGFKVPLVADGARKVCSNITEVAELVTAWEEGRDAYPYEVDGMVVKVNKLALQAACGYTSHHPRWAIAYKFKAKQATSKLVNVEYQVGKVGSITPVAKIEPVQLAGVTVSSVSLHNEDFIKAKDLRLGDTVLVERAGDVIPYIVKALDELRDGSEVPIDFPTACPTCATPLVKLENEVAWRCPNYSCEAQVLQRMIFHVSKAGMDIDGFGKSYVERFYQLGWLRSLADIYRLDYDQIAALEGFGERSAENLRQSIDKAKQNPLHKLLQSLSVHHLGKRAAQLLAHEIKDVFELLQWKEEEYTSIKDIGPKVAANVMAFLEDEHNVQLLRELEAAGVNVKQLEADLKPEVNEVGALAGKTILFTGSFAQLKRTAAQKMAEAAGARVLSAVSSKLDILVVGEKAGSKLKKAEEIGTVEIIDETTFLSRIEAVDTE